MQIKLRDVRLAFCQNLFKAGSMAGSNDLKFQSTFIIAGDDPQVKVVEKAITDVATEKWQGKAGVILKSLRAENKVCLKNGDAKAQYEGFEGNFFMSTSSKQAPKVLDRDRSVLTEADGKPYAGCYVTALLDIWAQDNDFGKRINVTLKGVQFVRDGDAFVGSAPAAVDDFDDLSDTGDSDLV
jgi:hypothetical protein